MRLPVLSSTALITSAFFLAIPALAQDTPVFDEVGEANYIQPSLTDYRAVELSEMARFVVIQREVGPITAKSFATLDGA